MEGVGVGAWAAVIEKETNGVYYYLIAEEILITFYSTDDRHSGEHTTAKVTQNRCRLRELSRM